MITYRRDVPRAITCYGLPNLSRFLCQTNLDESTELSGQRAREEDVYTGNISTSEYNPGIVGEPCRSESSSITGPRDSLRLISRNFGKIGELEIVIYPV